MADSKMADARNSSRHKYYDDKASGQELRSIHKVFSMWDARFAAVSDVYREDYPGCGVDDGIINHVKSNYLVTNTAKGSAQVRKYYPS